MGKWSCSMKLNSSSRCTIMAENSTTNYKKTVGINSLYKSPEAYNQAVFLMKVGKLQNKSLDIHIIFSLHYFQV
ncbi:unnamed protein product [Acanthoscelides obtectus]|uniref:Uncharacterized protein n=1 Tax=Acanthoscelides obtectus TaxID=200917 RepID=A0A9P0PW04_ACAOB|nr:unnamed protein product [Acanthoscelides obtectus]CAK1624281.1 hypothetical protein AOBTE_LOCUS2467 [Acanthoscelides obtectus]